MEPVAIEPTTWTAVIALIAGAASIMVPAALGVVLFWLRNVKAQLDVAHALLLKQQKDLQANSDTTAQIEKQTNGVLAAAREEATKYRSGFERLAWILREVNGTEDGSALIDGIMQRHRTVIRDDSYDQLMADLLKGVKK
jgi:hypothetical protein